MSARTFLYSVVPSFLADWQLPWAARMHRRGRLALARAVYRRILARVPQHFSVLQLMAVVALSRQRHLEALHWLERARAARPDEPRLESPLGCALMGLGRETEAEACFQRGRQHPAARVEATVNLAYLYRTQRRFDEALALYLEAARLGPGRFEPLLGAANVLVEMHRLEQAVGLLRDLLRRFPRQHAVMYPLARALVLAGKPEQAVDLVRGGAWALRFDGCIKNPIRRVRVLRTPWWRGEAPVAGRTVLVHAESGLGDAIQACRAAKVLADRGARVVLEVWPALVRLLRQIDPRITVVGRMDPLPPHDLHVDLDELPFLLGLMHDRIPPPPVLPLPDGVSQAWARRLGPRAGQLRVGFVCSGNPQHNQDLQRSMAIGVFLTAMPREGVEWFCLQRVIRPADAGALAQRRADVSAFPEHLHDFAETAGLIGQMDLVISVDTSVAHLAATLGKPTWILLPHTPDPRWMLGRSDTPWYPSVRLFRQGPEGRWAPVLAEVARDLEARVRAAAARSGAGSFARPVTEA